MGGEHIVVISKETYEKKHEDFGDVWTWGLDFAGRLGYVSEIVLNNDEEPEDNCIYIIYIK